MNKKVILVNPPQANSLDDFLDPPLGLMYIASNMERHDIPSKIVDLASKPEEQWGELIGEADIMGMTMFSASFNVSRKIAAIAKKQNPNLTVIVGGPHPTSLPEQTLAYPEFDTVIIGEGEEAMIDLAQKYYAGIKLPKIIEARKLSPLDSFPPPARQLVSLREYHRSVEGKHATSIITSRGCFFNCNFCCRDIHGTKVRFHSVERVLNELNDIKNTYGINSVLFYDDVFTFNSNGRLDELCRKIKPLRMTFRCNGRVGVNKPQDYITLKEAGCEEIAFGIESGSQTILDRMNKRITVQQNEDTLRYAKEAGLKTKAFLIVGFPGENEQTVEETKRFIERADPDKFTLFAFVPLPGCDVWKNPDKYGITYLSQNWDQYFNIAGQYEGGVTFETKELSKSEFLRLHDDLVHYLMAKGQRGSLERFYSQLKK